jgi:hypothetical protein
MVRALLPARVAYRPGSEGGLFALRAAAGRDKKESSEGKMRGKRLVLESDPGLPQLRHLPIQERFELHDVRFVGLL